MCLDKDAKIDLERTRSDYLDMVARICAVFHWTDEYVLAKSLDQIFLWYKRASKIFLEKLGAKDNVY